MFRGYGPGPAILRIPARRARSYRPGPQIADANQHHQDTDAPADDQVRQPGLQPRRQIRAYQPAGAQCDAWRLVRRRRPVLVHR
jgi:hypothetical protein